MSIGWEDSSFWYIFRKRKERKAIIFSVNSIQTLGGSLHDVQNNFKFNLFENEKSWNCLRRGAIGFLQEMMNGFWQEIEGSKHYYIQISLIFSPLVSSGTSEYNETLHSNDPNQIAKDTNKFFIDKLNLFSWFAYWHYFSIKKMEGKEAVDKALRSRVPGYNRKKYFMCFLFCFRALLSFS